MLTIPLTTTIVLALIGIFWPRLSFLVLLILALIAL